MGICSVYNNTYYREYPSQEKDFCAHPWQSPPCLCHWEGPVYHWAAPLHCKSKTQNQKYLCATPHTPFVIYTFLYYLKYKYINKSPRTHKMCYGKNWLCKFRITKSPFIVWHSHYFLASGCLEKRFTTKILK